MRTTNRLSTVPEAGAGLLMVVILLFAVVSSMMVVNTFIKVSTGTYRNSTTTTNLDRIRDALVAFAAANGHLPCPASGGLNTGTANPIIADPVCASPDGTVPWATLGISQDTALDGWGRKISYRVFAGNTGLTQPSGASMVNCDNQKPGGAAQLPANGLCAVDHSNHSSQFLNNKGLTVSNGGINETRIAFVLISHGATGHGAWLSDGNRMQMPNASNTSEFGNTGSGGTYYRKPFSESTIQPDSADHFDDELLWIEIEDLARRSGLVARDWPEDEPEFSAATTTDMTITSTDRFNLKEGRASSVTTTTTVDAAGRSVTTLQFAPAGANQYFTNCIWWPQSLITYNGVDKFALHAYLEFSTADGARSNYNYDDLGGMVLGFLPWKSASGTTNITSDLCGITNASTYLGWVNQDDTAPNALPAPRFGVEYDAYFHFQNDDPWGGQGHLSLVYSGVHHGVTASNCNNSPGYLISEPTCYTGTSNSWLRDGLNNFHRIRLLVSPKDATCSSAPKITIWLFPYSVCADSANSASCNSLENLNADFVPASLPTGAVSLTGCISPPTLPTPSDAFDRVFFGITLANRDTSGNYPGVGMLLRNLSFNGRMSQ